MSIVELNPNLTQVFVQLGIYLSLIFILTKLYFQPILALLRKRDSLTSGRVDEAADLKKQTENIRAQYEARMLSLREVLDQERAAALKVAREKTEAKIADAKANVEKKVLAHQKDVQSEYQKLREKLPEMSQEISKEIVSAITGSRVVRA